MLRATAMVALREMFFTPLFIRVVAIRPRLAALTMLFAMQSGGQLYSQPQIAYQPFEPLPVPHESSSSALLPNYCEPVPPDPRLAELAVDIAPRTLEGQVVASDDLPKNCGPAPENAAGRVLVMSCGRRGPGSCDVLQLARFRHHPLYFNDECLERYGVRSCCVQPAASAARFYGGALLMPVRVLYRCPCSCVSTPPPCCPDDASYF
jgi:hypothetical protein